MYKVDLKNISKDSVIFTNKFAGLIWPGKNEFTPKSAEKN